MEPFRIAVSDSALADLRRRLGQTRFARPVRQQEPTAWGVGTAPDYLRDLIEYWATDFDWRARESQLNSFPQFTADVAGETVHFVYLRAKPTPDDAQPIPVILSHGWPYSFIELLALGARLADPAAHGGQPGDAFDVVIPSLPGFGFSEPMRDEPFVPRVVAARWHTLMTEVLGYDRYATYGEDVGAPISDWLAARYPEQVLGLFATHAAFAPDERKQDLSAAEVAFTTRLAEKWKGETAYSALQASKPDTLAATLNDSPAGLAAWLVEKFRGWSGEFESSWTRDEVLTTVMLYWVTETIGSSFQPYCDHRWDTSIPEIEVPVGVAVHPGETGFPQSYAARTYRDIRVWEELPSGGHFAGKETPDLLADRMRTFFRPLRG
ncbi:epoxide hydrolase family protein [Actinoalloteichus hymeniacidonis]|uniref:Hydrolase or acyltransferase of alpha/beta superfamily n=1 Tax=Actinoalloteichus hymeniacidonis TaxID=340345 RepID=A0AAC9HTC2_9PSEU|nr:epoxide hydrolase family protein [Actinoalloteichus hymeniacidonis]AOS64115.1 putative hydrolase or acyltransferase of alpha/beta superfamily [Actinoalloteichus hymeniacidonis]MBB5907821.1 pimeloyl-ACP methyl ester carboxylesterase [Actinoalloteichus hymeniacidonis]